MIIIILIIIAVVAGGAYVMYTQPRKNKIIHTFIPPAAPKCATASDCSCPTGKVAQCNLTLCKCVDAPSGSPHSGSGTSGSGHTGTTGSKTGCSVAADCTCAAGETAACTSGKCVCTPAPRKRGCTTAADCSCALSERASCTSGGRCTCTPTCRNASECHCSAGMISICNGNCECWSPNSVSCTAASDCNCAGGYTASCSGGKCVCTSGTSSAGTGKALGGADAGLLSGTGGTLSSSPGTVGGTITSGTKIPSGEGVSCVNDAGCNKCEDHETKKCKNNICYCVKPDGTSYVNKKVVGGDAAAAAGLEKAGLISGGTGTGA